MSLDDEHRREDDRTISALSQRIYDFIERYDRDVGELNGWRRMIEMKLETQGEILREISPAYAKGKWIVGIVMLGSIGIAVKSFWSHLLWR